MEELNEEWLARFRKGDPDAFESAYKKHGDAVYRLCRRLSGSETEAEDLTQETFLAAYRSRGRFEGRSALGTWLFRLALDRCRSRNRRKSSHELPLMLDPASSQSDLADTAAANIAVEEALMQLPERHRESLLLVKVEGLKYAEAAKVLDVPVGTVQYWVHEGVMRLRDLFPEMTS